MANLLVVDDDPDTARALAEVLGYIGHDVRIAFDGRQGLAQLDERLPDLVLLDVEMPVLGGPEMAERMFLHNLGLEHIPVVLISGVPHLQRVASDVGTPYALAKPFELEKLSEVVAKALSERIAPHPRLN